MTTENASSTQEASSLHSLDVRTERDPRVARITPGGVGVGGMPQNTGWYLAYHPKTNHQEIVWVRTDDETGEYVVDVTGQAKQHSEELWRYKEWVWSKELILEGWGGVSLPVYAPDGSCSHIDEAVRQSRAGGGQDAR